MKRTVVFVLAAIGIGLFGTGCATIVNGTHQDIPISSEPSGAAILVNGTREANTPANIRLARKQPHVVTIELAGYESESVALKPSIGGAVAGNIVAGGLIGWGVDASTGAQYNLHPDNINVRLRRLSTAAESIIERQRPSAMDSLFNELERLDSMKSAGKISPEEYTSLRAATLKKYQ